MTEKEANNLRKRIAELEQEMMDFRIAMARVISTLYDSVHELETWQRWNQEQEPGELEELKKVRDCIVSHFSLLELQGLCFDLGVNYDDLPGETINDKARELVLHMKRRKRFPELARLLQKLRPNVLLCLSQG